MQYATLKINEKTYKSAQFWDFMWVENCQKLPFLELSPSENSPPHFHGIWLKLLSTRLVLDALALPM